MCNDGHCKPRRTWTALSCAHLHRHDAHKLRSVHCARVANARLGHDAAAAVAMSNRPPMSARQKASSVVIALGTNVGNRGHNAWWAIQQLIKNGIQVERCSSLFETAPAYVEDQPAFLNAAVLARTQQSPTQLLATLKGIEQAAGRDVHTGPRWGPRPLDLDIIFMEGQPYTDGQLQIPHPRWRERDFVLHPVIELWYHRTDEQQAQQERQSKTASSPIQQASGGVIKHSAADSISEAVGGRQPDAAVLSQIREAASVVEATTVSNSPELASVAAAAGGSHSPTAAGQRLGGVMSRVTPVGPKGEVIVWGQRTLLMGILNITPDSFSDGGTFLPASPSPASLSDASGTCSSVMTHFQIEQVVKAARQMAADGMDILDVGGQSTRPGAAHLTAEQELARVMPVVRALRGCTDLPHIHISIDTFYAKVAREAVTAGADIVNDVSAGMLDPHMLPLVAELGVPYIMMHMRGDPRTMQQPHNIQYDEQGLVRTVAQELQARLDAAVAAGIPAWNIITDPGLGFAKTSSDSLQLLRQLSTFKQEGLQGAFRHGPMLVGPSRKGFLGKLTGRTQAKDRDAATVAAAVGCVWGGADIVRVHNVRDVKDGLKVADALFR